ncbi:NADPH-dependent assimilatory sulfite reductase hemoprotein subunit [Acidisoma cladoniae]|uniref:NADPH-dependent assimilatory sulfite reductase hemoprotein subunit n=1 Tax=Acidisoma cladoniae TaxID=3040935 RepID=UPI002550AA71|nr:NADPH-dependent assimilatory sulfite reductase hemoprotein subunit [Acidisoma sp. PAMC 29798]
MADTTDRPSLSRNEGIKEASRGLRGGIAEGLNDVITGQLAEDDTQLTKFHGIYQQDDRDIRAERGRKKMEKAFSFMARVRVPGGQMTPAQWLALDDIAEERANGTLRITTRQAIQFHGIIKSNLRPAINSINTALLDTLAACGDVNRNVMCAVNPYQSAIHAAALKLSQDISDHLTPKTSAYHEIWVDGEKVAGADEVVEEPIYGRTYLPRKFKITVAVPPQNDVDVYAHDLSFVAVLDNGVIKGWDVLVGGGMGMTHGEPDTFPRTADHLGFCTTEQAVEVAEKVVIVQRDNGNRSVRKHARLKYTIETMGLDLFRSEVERHLGYSLGAAHVPVFAGRGDRYGWTEGDDGRWHVTLFIESGRVKDWPEKRLQTGMREIARMLEGSEGVIILSPNQNLMVANISTAQKPAVEALLAEHGMATSADSGLRRNAMACVALPTCGLALAESERYMPELLTALEGALDAAGLRQDEIVIRMTGCPNGCARPYLAEIAFVGRGPGTYNLYLGGSFAGERLNKLYRPDIGHDAILGALGPLFREYAEAREEEESFGDFVIRAGHIKPTTAGNTFHADITS